MHARNKFIILMTYGFPTCLGTVLIERLAVFPMLYCQPLSVCCCPRHLIGVLAVQYWLHVYNGELQGSSVCTALFVMHLTFVRMFKTLIDVQRQLLVVVIGIGVEGSGNLYACGGIAEICVRISGAEIIDIFCFECIS